MRDTNAGWTALGVLWMVCSMPSIRSRTSLASRLGSMWMSLARWSKA